MEALNRSHVLGRTRLTFANRADIDEFVEKLEAFERGDLTGDAWRAFRLLRGTYGQRQEGDLHMVRVKIPQGVLDGGQLRALADVADAYSRGFGHITTRQNVQFHFVQVHDAERAMRRLAEVGLAPREACGNSVRNITGCPYAGVAGDEVFDVTPYAEALTRYFLRHPLSSSLPRKFKIAFEGCPTDHAATAINDIGWRAMERDGRRGFRVTVGGGTAILCRSGAALVGFLPVEEMLSVAEAVLRVFHRLGDYEHKARNRMKFLIKELGWERWREEFDRTLAEVRTEGEIPLPFDPSSPPTETPPPWQHAAAPSVEEARGIVEAGRVRGPGLIPLLRTQLPVLDARYEEWRRTNVRPQKQGGYETVVVTVPLGDLTGAQMRLAADLAHAYGDGTARVTLEQNLVFRWFRTDEVSRLYPRLAAAGLALSGAETLSDVTSCPGAESCRLAVTQSRGLGRLLGEHLRARPDQTLPAEDLSIKISGCPNGCGQHHVAGIGFQGSVKRLGNKVVPQYFLMVGGAASGEGARFGRLAAKIPVHRVAEALDRLLAHYRAERAEGETATAFFGRVEPSAVKELLADLEAITPEDARPEDYIDLAEDPQYKMEVQEGECSA
jgi:sulfite reductase (NADPH) hemoprotein beta-component